jgi:protocatechuate 3,4-dioxygenase beta subunit
MTFNVRPVQQESSAQNARMSRRVFLLGSAASASLLGGTNAPAVVTSKNHVEDAACVLAAEMTEGPYYVPAQLIRRDITEGKPGIPLRLRITVLHANKCVPLTNAAVSIWHCDASGTYSGFTKNPPDRFGPPPGSGEFQTRGGRPPGPPPDGWGPPPDGFPPPPSWFGPVGGKDDGSSQPPNFAAGLPRFGRGPTDKTTFFRGVQIADVSGVAEFTTIYPGWYMGRDTHIHLKVHVGGQVRDQRYDGGHVCHTGQLFFPDDLTDSVAKLKPYAGHTVERTRQNEDDVFLSQHGADFILSPIKINTKNLESGLLATVVVGVDPNAEPKETGLGGPFRPSRTPLQDR